MNMQFDFVVTDMTPQEAKEIYSAIVTLLGSQHQVDGGVYPAMSDDPIPPGYEDLTRAEIDELIADNKPYEPTQQELDNQAKTEKWDNPCVKDQLWEAHDEN